MDKILIISFWNPTNELPSKGLFIHEHVKAICNQRTDVTFLEVNILASKKKIFKKTISKEPYQSNYKIKLDIYSMLWKFILNNPWLLSLLIKRELKKLNPDFSPSLIHSNIIFPCGIVGHLLAKKYRAKHIITEHWSKIKEILSHPLFGNIASKAYKSSEAILCVSQFLSDKIRTMTDSEKTYVIPNIIDTNLYAYVPKNNLTKDSFTFACVAHWEKPKRLDLIIKSVALFAEQSGKKVLLQVIGKGSLRDEFIAEVNYPNNLSINWIGYVPKTRIAEILVQTDYLLHASNVETFSIVTVEAFSTGTPVLASNVGAIPELINATNGLVVENTTEAWVKGLHEITQRTYNHQLIADGVANKYSLKTVGEEINQVYENVLLPLSFAKNKKK